MKTYTIDGIAELEPFTSLSRHALECVWPVGTVLSAREIGELQHFSLDDRIQILAALLPDDRARRLWACTIVEGALHACYRGDDRSPWYAVDMARLFANGKVSESEMVAARDAVVDADSLRSAAWWVADPRRNAPAVAVHCVVLNLASRASETLAEHSGGGPVPKREAIGASNRAAAAAKAEQIDHLVTLLEA